MSGIAGIYCLDGRPVDRGLLQRMLDCVPHLGPDGARTWAAGSVGLGCRQLRTTEESLHEVQPAVNRDRTCRLVFDGRVDNREELIDRLRPEIGKLENPTDVALVLDAYDVWGVDCLKWVVGDFAFALWDDKVRRLFCARDTYGIRPFYYRFDEKRFVFASECAQLFEDPEISVEVDDDKVAEWFTWCGIQCHTYRDLSRSYFKGISELPFAHYLIVTRAGARLHKYWEIDPGKEIRYRDRGQYAEHFRELFKESVRCRLRSAGPVGAELSGGFDSSSIVCTAHELYSSAAAANKGFTAFSLVFDELGCDERPLITSVLDKYSVASRFVVADGLCGLLDPRGDEPARSKIDYPNRLVIHEAGRALYRLAHESGTRIMLSGDGAENHVIGTSFVWDSLVRSWEWGELLARLGAECLQSGVRSSLGRLVRFGLVPLLPHGVSRSYYYRWMHTELERPVIPDWFTPSFRDRILSRVVEQKKCLGGFPKFKEWGRQLEYEFLNPGRWVIQMPYPLPVERRFPYHDRRLVEFCLAVPPEAKYEHLAHTRRRNIRGRVLQRHGLEGILPEAIRQCEIKINYTDVYRRRFRDFGSDYLKLFASRAEPIAGKLGYIDATRFGGVLSDALRLSESPQGVPAILHRWIDQVAQLEIWLRAVASRQKRLSLSGSSLPGVEERARREAFRPAGNGRG
ncbi:MAG TPA: asparagine synthase-related protein [candidate division Zixibacteria bacterium]|nr:asparagine synthase-related protein [candidate division Zixibacteria bacterium]